MPLDGEDEMGMFCILLPQALDRSIKVRAQWKLDVDRNLPHQIERANLASV